MLTRREFSSAALLGLTKKSDRAVAGSFVNESQTMGHRIRDGGSCTTPKTRTKVPIVIVGGGIAGLSAAWRLQKRGFSDFVLLEMEKQPGGNSRWGENGVSAYPWAAHYLPVPNSRSALVRELMTDLGVLRNGAWEERFLCFTPQERMHIHGRWVEGIDPEHDLPSNERAQLKRFHQLIADARGTGEFTIPAEPGARVSPLDRVSMHSWLQSHGITSRAIHWYVDYACRDDYGSMSTVTSAWAGVHYFASREHEDKGPLTWPEGNGWIVKQLVSRIGSRLRTGAPVCRIARDGRSLRVITPDVEYSTNAVVFAAPTFVASYLIEGVPRYPFSYSPWVTANLTLDRLPAEKGVERAWDNVIYESPSLGYVDATHMSLRTHRDSAVWTWYHALGGADVRSQRQRLLTSDWSYWKEFILNDLSRAHQDLRQCVSRIDIMRHGHAMARPGPGSIFNESRQVFRKGMDNLLFANSDLSGFSIFEEAQYRGVAAADKALKYA